MNPVSVSYTTAAELRDAFAAAAKLLNRSPVLARTGRIARTFAAAPDGFRLKMELQKLTERGMPIITAYLCGDLPSEAAAEVEWILGTVLGELAFGSVVAAWRAPDAMTLDTTEREVDAAWAEFRRRRDS